LHIPHGQANAMLLPTVMGFNRMVCRERFSHIGRALTNKKSDPAMVHGCARMGTDTMV